MFLWSVDQNRSMDLLGLLKVSWKNLNGITAVISNMAVKICLEREIYMITKNLVFSVKTMKGLDTLESLSAKASANLSANRYHLISTTYCELVTTKVL